MNRGVLIICCTALVGTILLRRYAFPVDDEMYRLIAIQAPYLHTGLQWIWNGMLFSTSMMLLAIVFSLPARFAKTDRKVVIGKLPPYTPAADDEPLDVVMGELWHPRKSEPVPNPRWLRIPERGLFTNVMIVGAVGSGKTSSCIRPYATQILSWCARDVVKKVGGIVLEVKGNLCRQIQASLVDCGRGDDYVEMGLSGRYRYNPLHNEMDADEAAYAIACLIINLHGKGKEPFWEQAYTNLVKFVIILHKVMDGYCTLLDVYLSSTSPKRLYEKILEGEKIYRDQQYAWVYPKVYVDNACLAVFDWEFVDDWGIMRSSLTDDLKKCLAANNKISYAVEKQRAKKQGTDEQIQFEAAAWWFYNDWMLMKQDLRTSVVEGISTNLSLFHSNPKVARVFCPPKECYDLVANATGKYGLPLPSFAQFIDEGKVVALNFPMSENSNVAAFVGCLMKLDWQRAMLNRIPMIDVNTAKYWRPSMFLCDEYHMFATVAGKHHSGDEKFFSLSREAKCIGIVATQSYSSLRSTIEGEGWRTLTQTFLTHIFLHLSDVFTAEVASKMCGQVEDLVASYHVSESNQDAHVGWMTGRTQAHKTTLGISKNFSPQFRPKFQPVVFSELKNAQSIVLAYDGSTPLPASYLMLKPWYLDPNRSYWEQLAAKQL